MRIENMARTLSLSYFESKLEPMTQIISLGEAGTGKIEHFDMDLIITGNFESLSFLYCCLFDDWWIFFF